MPNSLEIPAIHVVWRLANVRGATLDDGQRRIKFQVVVEGFEETERRRTDSSIERGNGPAKRCRDSHGKEKPKF